MSKINKITVEKPWGRFEQFTHNQISTVKILIVAPGARLSYQSHQKREEFWVCIEGQVIAWINDVAYTMEKGHELWIPQGAKHRLIGSIEGGKILEISLGEFDEEDIIRYEDDYGRESK